MKITEKQESKLLAKMQQPLHLNYVSWLLKCSDDEAKLVVDKLVEEGKVEEYNPNVGKNYYVIKTNN
jgi:hypothetical protein